MGFVRGETMSCTADVTDKRLTVADLRDLVCQVFEEFSVPGGAAVIVGGGSAAVLSHGRGSFSGTGAVGPDTLFCVGSIAKTLVSTALAALVADGRLAWDDPRIRDVPEFGFPDLASRRRVSLRDCVANRLGLARQGFCEWGAADRIPLTDLLGRLAHTPLERPLGSGFSYSNPGHAAAALVVARVSGLPLVEFVRQRLLRPMGTAAVTAGAEARDWAGRSDCHVLLAATDRGERPTPVRVEPYFAEHAIGATGVWMSPAAIQGWLGLHLNRGKAGAEVVIAPAAYQQICMPQVTVPPEAQPFGIGPGECARVGYGLGWFCTDYRGHRVLHHSGAEVGANAHLSIVPDAGLAVGVVANLAGPAADVAGLTLLDALLGLPALPWARRAASRHPQAHNRSRPLNLRHGSRPGAALQAYAGRYRHAGNGPAIISVRGHLLAIRFPDAPRFDGHLLPLGGNWFAARPDDIGVRPALTGAAEFSLAEGRAAEFSLAGFGTWQRA